MSDRNILETIPCAWCESDSHTAMCCDLLGEEEVSSWLEEEASGEALSGSLSLPPASLAPAELPFSGGSPAAVQGPTWATWGTTARGHAHTLDKVRLSDGSTVYASDFYSRSKRTWQADVQVYLDRSWRQDGFGYMIEWPDYGLPECSPEQIIRYATCIMMAVDRGETVEVACLGSHGRTGTFLAILEVFCQEEGRRNGYQAVKHIRSAHCSRAVETEEQEWFVHYIACMMDGAPLPAKPKRKVAKLVHKSKSKGSKQHKSKGKGGKQQK